MCPFQRVLLKCLKMSWNYSEMSAKSLFYGENMELNAFRSWLILQQQSVFEPNVVNIVRVEEIELQFLFCT